MAILPLKSTRALQSSAELGRNYRGTIKTSISPDPKDVVDFLILILNDKAVSSLDYKRRETTYNRLTCPPQQKMVKVIQIAFSLQCMLVKCIETAECEDCVRMWECRGKPTMPEELSFPIRDMVVWALTVVDTDTVNPRCIENHEMWRARGWTRAHTPTMP